VMRRKQSGNMADYRTARWRSVNWNRCRRPPRSARAPAVDAGSALRAAPRHGVRSGEGRASAESTTGLARCREQDATSEMSLRGQHPDVVASEVPVAREDREILDLGLG